MVAIEMLGRQMEIPFAEEITRQTARLRGAGAHPPQLATVLVGDDPAARSYRSSIARTFRRLDVPHLEVDLPGDAGEVEVDDVIDRLNRDHTVTGVMLFLPLPGRRTDHRIRELLSPLKDVDGITTIGTGSLRLGRPCLEPACPRAGVTLLQAYGVELAGADVVVIGRSPVVGGPLATMLTAADATVTVAHRSTRDLPALTRRADIVACAAGQAHLLRVDMVRPGATVLDFGTNVVDGRLRGDADLESLRTVVSGISPVPGGTGPATAVVLAYQTMLSAHALAAGSLAGLAEAPGIAEVASRFAARSSIPGRA